MIKHEIRKKVQTLRLIAKQKPQKNVLVTALIEYLNKMKDKVDDKNG